MFNFHDRASLTNIKLCKNVSLQTEPPPCSIFVGNATQWEMFDTYITDEKIKEKEKLRSSIKIQKKSENLQDTSEDLSKLLPNAKIMERMLNLTIFDEIAQDFKYWEDPSDAFRNSGSLLPLWKFNKPAAIQIQYEVTCLCWNPYYSDLFAVGLGSYDFMKQYQGEIVLYSLKCPTHPEIIINVDTTVCSLDFHYEKGHLLAVGLYDGTVSIYNLKKEHNKLFLTSKDPNNKHFDPVWQIKWLSNDFDDNLNFISLSGDGRVINWIIVKNELKCSEIVVLKKEDCHLEGPEGIQLETISCGTALSFNKYDKALFIVGTEDGLIHKCSLSYSGRFLETYKYHSLRISKLQWNPYHSRIFISCSADWLVCIWDYDVKEPLFEFHMKHKVDDVSWAPYSSTIFAAITDRKIYVYDLTVNKESYICQQVVTSGKKTNANHIAFNSMHPIIIVGDNRGNVLSFKLSPNLRKNLNVANRDKEEFIKSEAEKFEELVTMF
ncbi:dynein axonemal intermediate chain 1 isoform X2 [Centruroides vittatus]